MDSLVTADWLAAHVDDVQVVDASFFLPDTGISAAGHFAMGHIPEARRLDIASFADPDASAPHMLPDHVTGCAMLAGLGFDRDRPIVVYDDAPHRTAARGWFTFRHYGGQDVAILDGGLAAWKSAGGTLETGEPSPRTGDWPSGRAFFSIITKADLLDHPGRTVLDARGRDRFEGGSPEPRPGLVAGHIPGARNLPYASLYDAEGRFLLDEELARVFAATGVDPAQAFIACCGSGVTACAILLAAHRLGHEGELYDGSWTEWGSDPATPKARGPGLT